MALDVVLPALKVAARYVARGVDGPDLESLCLGLVVFPHMTFHVLFPRVALAA